MHESYDVAAYIWPAYHHEPRVVDTFGVWPEKDGEWYTVRRGSPRFRGHDMPRVPLLGSQDEADPAVMRQHVELARAHGVNVFIVDWYWYENAPCFERQLNEGLIPALEGTDSKFYLMWANHDMGTILDMHVDRPDRTIWSGQVSREELEPMFERVHRQVPDPSLLLPRGRQAGVLGLRLPQLTCGASAAWRRRRTRSPGCATLRRTGFGRRRSPSHRARRVFLR